MAVRTPMAAPVETVETAVTVETQSVETAETAETAAMVSPVETAETVETTAMAFCIASPMQETVETAEPAGTAALPGTVVTAEPRAPLHQESRVRVAPVAKTERVKPVIEARMAPTASGEPPLTVATDSRTASVNSTIRALSRTMAVAQRISLRSALRDTPARY